MSGPTPVLFCADDFGLGPAVNAGILDLAWSGRLSAASCLSRAPSFARDAARLADSPVQLGLHLNLSESLGGAGLHLPLRALIVRSHLRQLDTGRLRAEIGLQLQAFEQGIGRAPDYVDGHQHVHQLPQIRDCLVDVLEERYGDQRPWLRVSRRPRPDVPLAHGFKARVIDALGARPLAALAAHHGFRCNRHLLGVYDFSGGATRFEALLAGWLSIAGRGDVLMCHPAQGSDASDPMGAQRQAEHQVLRGSRLDALLATHGVMVGRGGPMFMA